MISDLETAIFCCSALLHEARYSLFNAIGLNPEDQRYDISFTDTLLSKQDNIPQEEALEYLDKQPQYLALSSEIAAAKNKVNQANSSYLPNLKFSYYLQNYGGGYNFRGYQVGVSIPLWGYFNQHSMQNANWLAGVLKKNIPEIATVVPKTGRSDLANDWMGVHQTDVWVILKPQKEWRKGFTKEKIIAAIEPYLKTEPGLSYNFTQPIAMRVDELTSGVKSDLAVKIYGEDLETLKKLGDKISSIVNGLHGTANFYTEQPIGQPYLTIEIDREAVAVFGINVDDVQKVIQAGIGGETAGQVFEGQRRFDIIVRFPEDLRNSFEKIKDIPVHLPNGEFIPLKRVAHVVPQEGPREIQRENGWRRLIVGINIHV